MPALDSFSTSTSLLRRVADHDAEAWRQLVQIYGPLVLQQCLRCGLQRDVAEDVVQNTFVSVFRSLPNFSSQRAGSSFRGWLWTITRNKIQDVFRQQAKHTPAKGGTTALRIVESLPSPIKDDTPEPTDTEQTSALFHRALNTLRDEFPAKHWQAFWRTAIDGQTSREVAEELDMTPAAVRQTKSRVLRRLRAQLEF